MDLSTFEIPDSVKVHLSFPTIGKLFEKDDEGKDDKERPVTISLFGPASPQGIAYRHKIRKITLARVAENKGKKGPTFNGEEADKMDAERLVAYTAGVENLSYKGQTMAPDNILALYSDPKMGWLCNQLIDKLESWDSFLE